MILTFNFPDSEHQFEHFKYPGGEHQVRLTDLSVRYLKKLNSQADKVRVVARINDGEIVQLAQLLDAIKGVTACDVQLILPYLPYARADRRFVEGDCDGLAVFGRLLGMIGYDIVTLDAHSPKSVRNVRHLTDISPKPIIDLVIDKISSGSLNTTILLPDAGADRYNFPKSNKWLKHASKMRDPKTGKLSGFEVPASHDFEPGNILIVDDICDGGATFIGMADALRIAGVKNPLYLYVTHGIFSKGYRELATRFHGIFTTDSYHAIPTNNQFLVTIPCMPTILGGLDGKRT